MNADLRRSFAEFLVRTPAVKFGDFLLKSGKRSNIFFDFGGIASGEELAGLGRFFANYIVQNSLHNCDAIFGPAYKAISIAIATSIALYQDHNRSLPVAFNRKMEKSYAEGGRFIGCDLTKARRVLVVDDVITDGGTKYETIDMLSAFSNLRITAFVVGVDRQEKDPLGRSWAEIFQEKTGIEVHALTNSEEVLRIGQTT